MIRRREMGLVELIEREMARWWGVFNGMMEGNGNCIVNERETAETCNGGCGRGGYRSSSQVYVGFEGGGWGCRWYSTSGLITGFRRERGGREGGLYGCQRTLARAAGAARRGNLFMWKSEMWLRKMELGFERQTRRCRILVQWGKRIGDV